MWTAAATPSHRPGPHHGSGLPPSTSALKRRATRGQALGWPATGVSRAVRPGAGEAGKLDRPATATTPVPARCGARAASDRTAGVLRGTPARSPPTAACFDLSFRWAFKIVARMPARHGADSSDRRPQRSSSTPTGPDAAARRRAAAAANRPAASRRPDQMPSANGVEGPDLAPDRPPAGVAAGTCRPRVSPDSPLYCQQRVSAGRSRCWRSADHHKGSSASEAPRCGFDRGRVVSGHRQHQAPGSAR